jgi:hypothetical protein
LRKLNLSKHRIGVFFIFIAFCLNCEGQWVRLPHRNGTVFPNQGEFNLDLLHKEGVVFDLSRSAHGFLGQPYNREHLSSYDTSGIHLNHVDFPNLPVPGRNHLSNTFLISDSLVFRATNYDLQYDDTSSLEMFSLTGGLVWRKMGTAFRVFNVVGWNDSIFLYWGQEGLVTRSIKTRTLIHQISLQKEVNWLNRLLPIKLIIQ